MRPAVSIKPATPVKQVEPYMREFDRILVMTVEPGFGGQSFMPEVLVKVDQLRDLSSRGGFELEIAVDGGIRADAAASAVTGGAAMLISGVGDFSHSDGINGGTNVLGAAAATVG